jgi:hypothetical protein
MPLLPLLLPPLPPLLQRRSKIFLNDFILKSIRNAIKCTIYLLASAYNIIDVVAGQDRDARALLAEISLGARLQAHLARQIRGDVLKSRNCREKALDVRQYKQSYQEYYKKASYA